MAAKINWRRYGTKLRRCHALRLKIAGDRRWAKYCFKFNFDVVMYLSYRCMCIFELATLCIGSAVVSRGLSCGFHSAGPNLTSSSRHRRRLASSAAAADEATCVGGQNVIPASSFHPFLQRDFPDKSQSDKTKIASITSVHNNLSDRGSEWVTCICSFKLSLTFAFHRRPAIPGVADLWFCFCKSRSVLLLL